MSDTERYHRRFSTLDEVKQANASIGHHWFDRDTLRFFSSRFSETLHGGRFFVSSERPPHGPRAYTVREALSDGSVETRGEFMAYANRRQAQAAAAELARTEPLGMSRREWCEMANA